MRKLLLLLAALAFALPFATPKIAHAQAVTSVVAYTNCNTQTYTNGQPAPQTQNLLGQTCDSGGSVAQGSTSAGQPGTLVQCAVLTASPTYTSTQTDPLSCFTSGGLRTVYDSGSGPALTLSSSGGDGSGGVISIPVTDYQRLWNGATYDKTRNAVGAASGGNGGVGVVSVEQDGLKYTNITTGTTTTVKSGAGTFATLCYNTYVASATITIYDNTTASAPKIATITLPSTVTSLGPICVSENFGFNTGLTVVTSGATDLTVGWR